MIKSERELRELECRISELERLLGDAGDRLQDSGLSRDEIAKLLSEFKELQKDRLWYERASKREELPICDDLSEIGRLLIAVRVAKGISQLELAELTKVSRPQVSRDENGNYGMISADRASKILKALGARISLQVEYKEKTEEAVDTYSVVAASCTLINLTPEAEPRISSGVTLSFCAVEKAAEVRAPEVRKELRVLFIKVACKNTITGVGLHAQEARKEIEREVLSEFSAKKLAEQDLMWQSVGEYELVFSQPDQGGLDKQLAEIAIKCEGLASKKKCSAKVEIKS